jgi:hypothetical protein
MMNATLRLLYPWERERIPIAKEADSAPGPVWTREKNLASLGFDPRTVQPVASSYTDYAIPAHLYLLIGLKKFENVCIASRGKTESDVKCEFWTLCISRPKYFSGGRV